MSAVVDIVVTYRPVCVECLWWGDQVENEQTAFQDRVEHNAKHHGGDRDE